MKDGNLSLQLQLQLFSASGSGSSQGDDDDSSTSNMLAILIPVIIGSIILFGLIYWFLCRGKRERRHSLDEETQKVAYVDDKKTASTTTPGEGETPGKFEVHV